ncbi:MAG TPA: ATP-binding cassette domain-containing protein, partial [Actinomycetota bacterium]|nr:ATP-binding cassette domain-containing protein [Actinomycetota bacterium]
MNVIEVQDLWEGYRASSSRRRSMKDSLASFGRRAEPRWGLRGVSFDIPRGQMVGIIGANGSGKSTLLRCLAGIYRPTKGTVTLRGRASNLIDLEAGFQRDLSATDNIYLAGAVYGIPKREMKSRFDEVFTFSGLEGDADTLLRAFS